MKVTDRGYKIPEAHDSLELSVEKLKETLLRINDEQNTHDRAVRELKKQRRRAFLCTALGYNPWEVKQWRK